jgi:capsular polysaccharide biosynthesis protein
MRELKSRWPKVEYAVFDDSFANSRPLSDHIAMFASAKVIIGAHGAGLANMMWSAPGTVVIETGFDQCRDGCMDTYYDMALGLGHQYHYGARRASRGR